MIFEANKKHTWNLGNIKLAVKNAHEKLYIAEQNLIENKTAFKIATDDYKMQQFQYKLGLISKLMLDSNELIYIQKENNNEKAVQDYYLAMRAINLAEKGIFVN